MMTPKELDEIVVNVRDRTGAASIVMVVLRESDDNEVCIVNEVSKVPDPIQSAINVLKNSQDGNSVVLMEEHFLGE